MPLSTTAEPMTAQGQGKGEPSSASMRNGFRTQPARLVRGSSRRIMSLRFRPAYIRVINRRASSWAVIGSVVQKRERRQCPSAPPPPPTLRCAGLRSGSGGSYCIVTQLLTCRSISERALHVELVELAEQTQVLRALRLGLIVVGRARHSQQFALLLDAEARMMGIDPWAFVFNP